MVKTEFFNDFKEYYNKAKVLQNMNCNNLKTVVNDPIMDNVTIYDTVNRRFAGFSKVLEDLHGVRVRKDLIRLPNLKEVLSIEEYHFLHLLHRFTGSGASFQPTYLSNGSRNPKEHGYHNNIVGRVANVMAMDSFEGARHFIVNNKDPMVTSTGNQPPSLKNPDPSKYRLAQQYYFDQIAETFVNDYITFLKCNLHKNNKTTGIKEAVDFCCDWHSDRKFKRWHFVLTAFVMDTAEYYPGLVDPASHCYYGANCVRAFDLMFLKEKTDPKKKAEFQELCMAELCSSVNGKPYDVEDVCCDYIRYLVQYIPKGYNNLTDEQKQNNSTLKVSGIYPEEIQRRISEIIG